MPESLLRHARGQEGWGDLHEWARSELKELDRLAAGGGIPGVLVAAGLGEVRAVLARLSDAELPVDQVYAAGRLAERELLQAEIAALKTEIAALKAESAVPAAFRARARHAAPRPHPHLRVLPSLPGLVPAAAAGGWALARHGGRVMRAHAMLTAAAGTTAVVAAGTVAGGSFTVAPWSQQPATAATAPAPARTTSAPVQAACIPGPVQTQTVTPQATSTKPAVTPSPTPSSPSPTPSPSASTPTPTPPPTTPPVTGSPVTGGPAPQPSPPASSPPSSPPGGGDQGSHAYRGRHRRHWDRHDGHGRR